MSLSRNTKSVTMWLDNGMLDTVITVSSNVKDTSHTGTQRTNPESASSQGKDEHYLPVQRGTGQGRPLTQYVAPLGEGFEC